MLYPLSNTGSFVAKSVSDPAVATDFSMTLSSGFIYRIQAVFMKLVTDANAANRYPAVVFKDGTVYDFVIIPSVAIAANTTARITAMSGLGITAHLTSNYYNFALPTEMYLKGGTEIESLVRSIQAGDQLSDIRIYYHTWPDLRA